MIKSLFHPPNPAQGNLGDSQIGRQVCQTDPL